MAFLKSSFSFILLMINLVISSLIVFFSLNIDNEIKKHISNEKNSKSIPSFGYYILYINCASFFFEYLFIFSFCVSNRGCCCNKDIREDNDYCCKDCRYSDTSDFCIGTGGKTGDGEELLAAIAMFLISAIGYTINTTCGKHISRIIETSFLCMIQLTIIIISIYIGDKYDFGVFTLLTLIFSFVGFICNVLAILLPNINRCEKLRPPEVKPLTQPLNTTETPVVVPLNTISGENSEYENNSNGGNVEKPYWEPTTTTNYFS